MASPEATRLLRIARRDLKMARRLLDPDVEEASWGLGSPAMPRENAQGLVARAEEGSLGALNQPEFLAYLLGTLSNARCGEQPEMAIVEINGAKRTRTADPLHAM